jgi:hypothetical protein
MGIEPIASTPHKTAFHSFWRVRLFILLFTSKSLASLEYDLHHRIKLKRGRMWLNIGKFAEAMHLNIR